MDTLHEMTHLTCNFTISFFLSYRECKSTLLPRASVYRVKVSQVCRLENLMLTVITLTLTWQNYNLHVSERICRVTYDIPLLLSLTSLRRKFHQAPSICIFITMLPFQIIFFQCWQLMSKESFTT